jgi:hypothetical protein
MASTFVVSRAQLTYALCLPLAVLIGYFLAEPMESGSIAIVVFVLSVLSLPLLMKWYHPLLIMSWNALICPVFLPGRPYLWMVMSFLGLGIAILNRSVNPHKRFINVPSLTKPLVFLVGVVIITAGLTGGIGLNALGASRAGGKGYFFIFAAMAGYFGFTSQRIPPERAGLYVTLFFLSGLTALVSQVASLLGPAGEFLYSFFPGAPGSMQATAAESVTGFSSYSRFGAFAMAAPAIYGCMLARYGVRGTLDFRHPWRPVIFLLAIAGCAWCGYRSALVMLLVSFAAVFYWEGLHRTKLLPAMVGLALLAGAAVLPYADKLPLVVQRSLSFLPIKVDFGVRQSADSSTEWRVEMWKHVLPEVPRYLLKGKGYNLTADDIYWANQNASRSGESSGGSMVAGDYHSGPLSTIIPFGIWGVIAFIWFWVAGLRFLYHNYRFGDPALRRINTLLMALFAARIFFFLFVFGGFYSDLFIFTGLLGLGVSLNGPPVAQAPKEAPEEALSSFSLRV